MSDNYNAATDGTYVIQQGEDEKQFFFFRKDGGEINHEEADPMDLYQAFVCRQMCEALIQVWLWEISSLRLP